MLSCFRIHSLKSKRPLNLTDQKHESTTLIVLFVLLTNVVKDIFILIRR